MTLTYVIVVNVLIVLALAAIARFVKIGKAESIQGGWNFNYTTRDLVFIAVVAAISGVVNTLISQVWATLNALGPVQGALLQGAFMWNYLLIFFLVRKPGAMLIVALLELGMESLLGNIAGFSSFGWGITQGLAAEAIMAAVNYGVIGWWVFGLAGAAASQFGTVWTYYLYGWQADQTTYWLATLVDLVSGFVLSGLLGFWIGKLIENTGLVRATRQA
ncbi:MAG TPA: ECF transporter S component [Anaerolineales bacterium]|nr:ECF transporter S component [Anaerolineales bacterium]